jgi:DMSO/TMAO reductase YedYZ molybdopterin-dependent catalytic subunit
MVKHAIAYLLLGTIVVLSLVGCSAETTEVKATDEQPALTISGLVDKPQSWTVSQIKEMEKAYARALCADSGQERDFSGPPINALLDLAQPQANASKVVFKGEYDLSGEITLAELRANTEGIVAVTGSGKLRVILPGLPGTVQINGLQAIEVQ